MNAIIFNIKKWSVRAMMAVGTLLGISSCAHTKLNPSAPETVYGPPPTVEPVEIEMIEDVYGPPPFEATDTITIEEPESPSSDSQNED